MTEPSVLSSGLTGKILDRAFTRSTVRFTSTGKVRTTIVRKYWLLDQHDGDGPTALVYTDGSMHIVDVLGFGPGITELKDQQAVWDNIIGKLAPMMKPLVAASSIQVESVEPHEDLLRGDNGGSPQTSRADRRAAGQRGPAERQAGAPSRKGGRGDR